MKRMVVVLLVIASLLLTACGSGSTVKTDEGSADQPQETAEVQDTASGGIINDGLMTLGSVEGDVYQNETIGYGCELPGWQFASSEDLAAQNDWAIENFDEDLQEKLSSTDTFMDMFAEYADDESYMNVNVNVENLNLVAKALLDEQDYVDAAYPQMTDALEQAGFSNVQIEKATIDLAGDTHPGMVIQSEIQGIAVFQRQACVKCGEYMVSVTATSYVLDQTEEIFGHFFKL